MSLSACHNLFVPSSMEGRSWEEENFTVMKCEVAATSTAADAFAFADAGTIPTPVSPLEILLTIQEVDMMFTPNLFFEPTPISASAYCIDGSEGTNNYKNDNIPLNFLPKKKDIVEEDLYSSNMKLFDPTPVAPDRMCLVHKVDIGATWNHHDEPNTTELVKWLFLPKRRDDDDDDDDDDYSQQSDILDASCSSIRRPTTTCAFTTTQGTYCVPPPSKNNTPVHQKTNVTHHHTIKVDSSSSWEKRMKELIQYRKQYGNVLVPHNWIGNKPLAQFVKRQRYQYKLHCAGRHTTLTEDRIQELNNIGFIWDSHEAAWDEKFHALEEFSKRHGHCNVPSRYVPHPQLSVWIRCQRRQYKVERDTFHLNPLTLKRFTKLQSIGFVFSPRSSSS